MVKVRVRNERDRGADKVPGLSPKVKIQLQFRQSPIGLYGGSRPAFDRVTVDQLTSYRDVINHQVAAGGAVKGVFEMFF